MTQRGRSFLPWLACLAALAWWSASSETIVLARPAARDAMRQNLAIPLSVAGHGSVTVTVRFDGEP